MSGGLTIISLPWPPKELSPNARVHYMAKSRAVKAARQQAWALILEAMGCAPKGKLLTVTFNPPDRRQYDFDNLISRTKAMQDGIADALGCNDHTFRPDYRLGNPTKGGAVVIEIGEVSE